MMGTKLYSLSHNQSHRFERCVEYDGYKTINKDITTPPSV